MQREWYLYDGESQAGPFTWNELYQKVRQGEIIHSTLVWKQGTPDWTRADEIPGLMPVTTPDHQDVQKVPTGVAAAEGMQGTAPAKKQSVVKKESGKKIMITLAAVVLIIGGIFTARHFLFLLTGNGEAPETIAYPWSVEEVEGVLGRDDGDWQNYPDREAEEEAIAAVIGQFAEALAQQDVNRSVSLIVTERQDAYRELFSANTQAMEGFAQLIARAEMSFLSEYVGPGATTFLRTAEYSVTLDDFTFYLVFMKSDDRWRLYDF